jgi:hypothetical protein
VYVYFLTFLSVVPPSDNSITVNNNNNNNNNNVYMSVFPFTERRLQTDHDLLTCIPTFLGAFARFEKRLLLIALSRLTVCMEQIGSHWTYLHAMSYLTIFRTFVEKIQVLLKSDKNNRSNVHFLIISRSVLLRTRNVSDVSCRETRKTHLMDRYFFF